jgi:hypothetical protein
LNSDFYGPLSFSGPDEEPYAELSAELQNLAKAAIHKAEMNSKRRMGDSDYQVIAPLGKDVMKVP